MRHCNIILMLAACLLSSTSIFATVSIPDWRLGRVHEPWLIRIRGIEVHLGADSSRFTIDTGSTQDYGGWISGFTDTISPELDVSYYFNDFISLELGATKSSHEMKISGAVAVSPLSGEYVIGSADTFVPSLMLQFHLLPNRIIDPYIGGGITYLGFNNESPGSSITLFKLDTASSPSVEFGFDIKIKNSWSINFATRKAFMENDVTYVREGNTSMTSNDSLPWFYMIGVGYSFE